MMAVPMAERGARWGLALLLAFAPLPFGAVLGWTTALLATGLGLLLVVMAASYLVDPRPLPWGCDKVAVAGGLMAAPGLLQLIPLPPALLGRISPATADLYAASSLSPDAWRPLSQDTALTGSALLWLAACTAAAFLVAALFDRRNLRRLMLALVLLGTAQSFYGILEFLSGNNRIFLYEKKHYLESATGTYINRNHFAGLLAMLAPIALAWVLARAGSQGRLSPRRWRHRVLMLGEAESNQKLLLGLAVAVMGTGLALSFSRAGVTVGLVALAATVAMHALRRSRSRFGRSRAGLVWASVLLGTALIPLLVRGPGRLGSMAENLPQELSAEAGRPVLWGATLRSAADHPLLGTGLGTFGLVFPRYRPVELQATYTHAHQDYLQWLSETGITGLLAGAVLLTGVGMVAMRAMRAPGRRRDRTLATGITAGLAAFALHGLVDFNGHIPANTLMAAVLVASLVVLGRPSQEETAGASASVAHSASREQPA